jgi:amino acid adenylation domain-containing protein
MGLIRETAARGAAAPLFDRRLKEERDYWLARLSPLPEPVDLGLERPAARRAGAAAVDLELPEVARAALERLTGGSPFLVCTALLTVLGICLYRLSGRRRMAVGTPALCTAEGVPPAPNALVLLLEVTPEHTFRELLLRTREALLAASERQSYPFELLLADLGLEPMDGGCPLFDVALVLAEIHTELPAVGHSLTLRFCRTGGRLAGRLEARPGRLGSAGPERFATRFRQTFVAALKSQATPVGHLALLAEAEWHQVVSDWNDTARAYGEVHLLHRLVEAQVDRTPGAIAVIGATAAVAASAEGRSITYRELDLRANRLAHRLVRLGVGPDVPVGLYLERSVELIVALLGTLKAGGAWLPLDPGYPRERIELMLADSGAPVVLTLAGLADGVPAGDARVVLLDGFGADAADAETTGERLDPGAGAGADNLAYVIYTSGSTGRPKGTLCSHRAICNRLLWMQEEYGLEADDRVLQKTPVSFDVSVWELFWPLLAGARLVLARPGGHRDSSYLASVIRAEAITTLHFVPSMLRVFLLEEDVASCGSLRRVICSGEVLPLDLAAKFLAASKASLHNLYGPTEAAVDVTHWRCSQGDAGRGTVPIGRPIANLRLHLLAGDLCPVVPGGRGDLYIGGAGLARGYHRRPELTAASFVPDLYGGGAGDRLYRTGDRARLGLDGAIEFLGRADDQVKIRGVRIEPGEIEAVLRRHPDVRDAAVVVREDRPGDPRLVAYTVFHPDRELSPGDLRAFLSACLPEALVPAAWVRLDALPLSPSGKLDRRALPAPAGNPSEIGEAPLGPSEEVIARVWASVLGVPRVGALDDFFALGGHSLLATQVAARLRSLFRIDLPVVRLFEKRTVRALSREIAGLRGSPEVCDEIARLLLAAQLPESAEDVEGAAPEESTDLLAPAGFARFERLLAERGLDVAAVGDIPRSGATGPAPLALHQESLWFLQQVEGESATYNLMVAVRLAGDLDRAVLERSFADIVRRHEALRTLFRIEGGVPVQVVAPASAPSLDLLDLGGLSTAAREREVLRLARGEAARPFHLTRGPLSRVALARLGAAEHVLVLTCHHIVSDGWSLGIFVRELAALYRAFAAGLPTPLAEPSLSYRDFARWQRGWLQGEVLATQLAYWRRQLAGAPRLRLPTDRPRSAVQTSRGATLPLRLTAPLAAALRAVCGEEGATLFMALLAGFKVLLRASTGQDDVVVGTDIANRGRRELEGLIGFFVNSLVLRTDLGGDPTFRELLRRVRETALGAYAHQDLPFSRLVEELRPERDRSQNPLFQVTLSLHNFPRQSEAGDGLQMSSLPVHGGSAKFDLSLFLAESGSEVEGLLEYNADLFMEATASRLVARYDAILAALAADPDRRLSELKMGGAGRAAVDDFNENLEVY